MAVTSVLYSVDDDIHLQTAPGYDLADDAVTDAPACVGL